MGDLALSLLMLAAFSLIVGAIVRWRREGPGTQVWLMLIAAAVMLANVAIWLVPGDIPASNGDGASGTG